MVIKVRRLTDVVRPPGSGATNQMSDKLTVEELSGMDAIEFLLHECDDSPGVLSKKG